MRIDQISWTFENIEFLISLNCTNVSVSFNHSWKYFELVFLSTSIQLLGFESDQRLVAEWETIKFDIIPKKLKRVILHKTDTMNYLFIPFDSISNIKYSGLKIDSDAHTINKHFEDLDFEKQIQVNWFVIPLKILSKLLFNENWMVEYFGSLKEIENLKIKAKHIDWEINSSNYIFRIYNLFIEDFSPINFSLNYLNSEAIKINQLSLNLISSASIESKFSSIEREYILSSDEFNLWKEILSSRKTRFSITSIKLKLRLLSECLTILSLCADCPELEFINLQYVEVDSINLPKTIENAERKFRKKIGFIKSLKILKTGTPIHYKHDNYFLFY